MVLHNPARERSVGPESEEAPLSGKEGGRGAAVDRKWLVLMLAATLVAGLLPLLWDGRFYFKGDTQAGAFGQWVHLGRELRAGRWPLLDLPSWRAGNFVSEGQWGLYSPLTLGVALLASVASSAVAFCTTLKLLLLLVTSAGAFLLTRSYGVSPPFACVAGLAVTVGGTTVYLESPSWVTGQMVEALLPWCWWSLRRTSRGANPLPAVVSGYLIVSVGYVYGTLYLGLVLLACFVDACLARDRVAALRTVLVGICSGLVAVTVYLPGVLTASVTTRSQSGVVSEGRLQGDLQGLVTSMLPLNQVSAGTWDYPTHYVVWFLPVLLWVPWARARERSGDLVGAGLVLLLSVLWVVGPNAVGPLRWPVRVLPLVVLCTVVVLVVLLDRVLRWRPVPSRLVASLAWVGLATYLVTSRHWDMRHATWLSAGVAAAGLLGCWLLLGASAHRGADQRGVADVRRTRVGLFVVTWTLGVVVLQHVFFPSTPAVDRNLPSRVADYASAASEARGDTVLVGDPEAAVIADPALTRDFLVASAWYVGPHPVQSVYTTIGFAAYNARYCIRYNGTTCEKALGTLVGKEPTTGVRRLDLLAVSSVQIYRHDFADRQVLSPPAGWRVARTSPDAVTWVRDRPVPGAGGVVWTSDGTRITQGVTEAGRLTFTVDAVPPGGGTVVLSRLDWPGYEVSGGTRGAPTDGYLLTVDVPGGSTGQQVSVEFLPPGWQAERLTLLAGLVVGLGWSLLAALRARRRTGGGRPTGIAARRVGAGSFSAADPPGAGG